MEEWKEYKLGDVCSRIKSGKNITAKNVNDNGPFPVIGGNGIRGYANISNFNGDCCVIGRQGAYCGNVHYYDGEFYMTEHAVVVVANDLANTHFLSYLLSLQNLGHLSAQSAQPGLSIKTLSGYRIKLPNINIQNKIVDILSSLDEKIEINRKINENLEQQAQALFKSWFVDFEPFKNGKFVDSELGMIPEGWEVGKLEDIGEIVGGGTPSKSKPEYYCENGIHWITPKDLSITKAKFTSRGVNDITKLGYDNSSTKLIPANSILFSSRAPIGYISIALNDLCTNQGFKSVVPKKSGTAFIYYYLLFNTENIKSQASGSTFKEASGSLIKSQKVIIPDDETLNKFELLLRPLLRKQSINEQENEHLSSLRDTLLPKLMSGEIEL